MPVRKNVKPAESKCGCENSCNCGGVCACEAKPEAEKVQASPRGTKVLSLTSFIASFIEPFAAVVVGHVALNEYKKKNLLPEWKNFAVAGLVLGYAGIVLRFFFITTLIGMFSLAMMGGHHYYPDYPIYYSEPQVSIQPVPMIGYGYGDFQDGIESSMPMGGMNR